MGSALYAQSPGVEIGTTYYDFQTIGPIGNRITVCEDGTWFTCWTRLLSWPYPPGTRNVWAAWHYPGDTTIYSEPLNIDAGGGLPTVDLINTCDPVFAYFEARSYITMNIGVDSPRYFDPPDSLPDSSDPCSWPYFAVNGQNNIYLLMTEMHSPRVLRLGYTMSSDGGNTWQTPRMIDTVMIVGSTIDASPVSNRVAYAYSQPIDTLTFYQNNIVYRVSNDGYSWGPRVNITNYGNDDDSLWAFTDVDIIFDYDDYLHVIWTAFWVSDEAIHSPTFLFHYSEETGEITEITHYPDSDNWTYICGNWTRPICKINSGVQDSTDNIFVTWTQYDTSDVSAGGYGNGDIFMSYSDGGAYWQTPENITNSQTPGCYPGNCDSDIYASLADLITDSLRIQYLNDKDAGSIMQTEGAATVNPVKYLAIPTPVLLSADDLDSHLPSGFTLNQNYPNPFNQSTSISFSIPDPGPVKLEIFDITGALVLTLVDDNLPAGNHQVTWDAGELASGTYLCKLTSGGAARIVKALLIK